MNLRRELIAFAVRVLADKSNVIHKPDQFSATLETFLGIESYDKRLAREIDNDISKVTNCVKQKITDRKFKKITENI